MLLPEGLIPSSYSPFTDDYKLDTGVLKERLESVIEGSNGLHGPANHSELTELTFDEWKKWTDVMVDICKKNNLQSWSFLGTESFEKTIPYIEYALEAGADGMVVLPPYKAMYSPEAGYLYIKDIAERYPNTPVCFYNIFSFGTLDPYLVARLADIPNIVGMKTPKGLTVGEAGDLYNLTRKNNHFRIIAGSLLDRYALRGFDIKASYSNHSNYIHPWCLKLWNALQSGDWETADLWHEKISKLEHAFYHPGGFLHKHAGAKAAMALLGRPVGRMRRPALPPTQEQLEVIRKALVDAGLI